MLVVHRWFGLTIGLFFVLLGLSGSYLVYKDTFQEWIGADVRRAAGLTGPVDLARAAAAAQEGLGVPVPPTAVAWSDDPRRNLEFGFTGLPGMGRASVKAFVDPVTNEYRGKESFRETFSGMVFFFHHDIFLGGTGRVIMAVAGFAMLFILLGGLYLWWPRKQTWARVLKLAPLRNPVQANLELHRFLGFHTLLLMVMVTFSGVYISKPNWFQSVGPRGGGGGARDEAPPPLVDFAKLGAFLEGQPKPLSARIDARKSRLQLRLGDAPARTFDLQSFAEVEPEAPRPRDMRGVQRMLHAGNFWGRAGEILIFISGLLPLFFYVSGIYVWWKKAEIRRRRRVSPKPAGRGPRPRDAGPPAPAAEL